MNKKEHMKNQLMDQLHKHWRLDNSKSYGTKKTYHREQENFVEFVYKKYKLQSLSRISNKHVVAYIEKKLDDECSIRTLKKIMSAIRCLNIQCEGKIDIDNKQLNLFDLDKYKLIPGTSKAEYLRALEYAQHYGDKRIEMAIKIMNEFGLRINETINLRFEEVRQCLKTGILHISNGTKGGRPREISYNNKDFIEELLNTNFNARKNNSDKILCSNEPGSVKKLKSNIENFFTRYGDKISDDNKNRRVTAHCFRKAFAQKVYDYNVIYLRKSDIQAMSAVCNALGHSGVTYTKKNGEVKHYREDITRVYVANRHARK